MMRNLLFTLLCACALSSCSKEETLPPWEALQGGVWVFQHTEQYIYETTHGGLLVRRQLDWEQSKSQVGLYEMRFSADQVAVSAFFQNQMQLEACNYWILNDRLYIRLNYSREDWGGLTIDGDQLILKTKFNKAPDFSRNDIIVHNYAVYNRIND